MNITFSKDALKGKNILLTGAGGGIGFETAKAFAQMGARVLIAEINREKGENAAQYINARHSGAAEFLHTDLSVEAEVKQLHEKIMSDYGCPDIIFNNATTVVTGRIGEVSIADWDKSYAVNLKAPVMLTTLFVGEMIKRGSGCIVFVSSSGAAPYLSTYETFKTAQAEFSDALSMELENTGVYAYTIAPGLVKTETAEKSIEAVAASMGMSTEDFYRLNEKQILSAADAGAGFAVSVLRAHEYNGRETFSVQALSDYLDNKEKLSADSKKSTSFLHHAELLNKIADAYITQYDGWQKRNVFERQWVLRDFKKYTGMPAEAVEHEFKTLREELACGKGPTSLSKTLFEKLIAYWEHQYQLLQGFEKDKEKREEYSNTIFGWIDDIKSALALFGA